jgi:hypothetical protein
MAKCPVAKNIILAQGGALSYTTPNTVPNLLEKHNILRRIVVENFSNIDTVPLILENEKVHETVIEISNKKCKYFISGRPDFLALIISKELAWRPLMLIGEVTLMPTVKHLIYGEILFYILSHYIKYGVDVAGLLISSNALHLVLPKVPEKKNDLKRYFEGESIPALLKKLFRSIRDEDAIEAAEKLRSRKPWICSLCDLRNICPISGER